MSGLRLSVVLAVFGLLVLSGFSGAAAARAKNMGPLQKLIDAAEENAVIVLEPGVYSGPAVVTRPLTIDGRGKATIDGGGKGSVIILRTNGATVKNLRLINSGDQHNDLDAGVLVRGDFNVVKDNIIEECLFGVDLQQSSNNIVRRNHISSKSDASLGVKGDAIRLWYSRNNKIMDNVISRSRDLVVWYSADNIISGNKVSDGRYGLHFMYSRYNLVENNQFWRNAVGIFLMYSDSVVVRKNRVFRAQGPAGVGIGFKEASNMEITDNEILYNSTGLYLDVSPFQPDTTNRIYRNTIAFNDTGAKFLNDWTGNLFTDNIFSNNIRHVTVSTFASAKRNIWEANYWDDYEGFDQDGDGFGDRPYRLMVYADRILMDVPDADFFNGTPILSMFDFMERLAPFTKPLLMLEDKEPRMARKFTPRTAAPRGEETNVGKTLEVFGANTNARTKAGTSMNQNDPFGLNDPNIGYLKTPK